MGDEIPKADLLKYLDDILRANCSLISQLDAIDLDMKSAYNHYMFGDLLGKYYATKMLLRKLQDYIKKYEPPINSELFNSSDDLPTLEDIENDDFDEEDLSFRQPRT